ncbi:MAG: hypothetical protein AB7P14_28110 [Blastocatellales bacterium]
MKVNDPIVEYLSALEKFYPAAIGTAEVIRRHDNRVIVAVPLPEDEDENIWLFDKMAEVGTKLLLETDEYIILSGQ